MAADVGGADANDATTTLGQMGKTGSDISLYFLRAADKMMQPQKYQRFAAMVLQARARGMLARRRSAKLANGRLVLQSQAARHVQCAARRLSARRYSKELMSAKMARAAQVVPGSPTSVILDAAPLEQDAQEPGRPTASVTPSNYNRILAAALCAAALLLLVLAFLPTTPRAPDLLDPVPTTAPPQLVKMHTPPKPKQKNAFVPLAAVCTIAMSLAKAGVSPAALAAAPMALAASSPAVPVGKMVIAVGAAVVGAAARMHPAGRVVRAVSRPAAQLVARTGLGARLGTRLGAAAVHLGRAVAARANIGQGVLGGGVGVTAAVLLSA